MDQNYDKNLNDTTDKLMVYENDDAYLLDECLENDSKEDNKSNENESIKHNPKKLLSKFDTDLSEEDLQRETPSMTTENVFNNDINFESTNKNHIDTEIYDEKKLEEIYNKFNSSKKLVVNELNSEEESSNKNNSNNDNIRLKGYFPDDIECIQKNKSHKKNKTEKNNENKNNESNKIINISTNNNNNENYEEESNDSSIPLITLNFLSVCQCCKCTFNSTKNIPYLFKCGHFFCKKCIEEQFIDKEGIKCPNDGLVAKSISELKILNNFITDKNINISSDNNPNNSMMVYRENCEYHKQKLTHFIEETKELICIYCAFEKYKMNPNIHIKEIKNKYSEMENDLNTIIDDNQYNATIIQNLLKEITKNKEEESKKILQIFDKLTTIINNKKSAFINKIDCLFGENAKRLNKKLENLCEVVNRSENLKKIILQAKNIEQDNILFLKTYKDYDNLAQKVNNANYYKLNLKKYKFSDTDLSVMIRLIENFGEFKIYSKNCTLINNLNENAIKEINKASNYKNHDNYFEEKNKNMRYTKTKINITCLKNKNLTRNNSTYFGHVIKNDILLSQNKNTKSNLYIIDGKKVLNKSNNQKFNKILPIKKKI